MAGNSDRYCSSDPTPGGCGDISVAVSLINAGNANITNVLTSIDNKLSLLQAEIEDCCEETNTNLVGIKDRLDTLISNAEECCEEIISRLNTIIGLMQLPAAYGIQLEFSDYVCVEMEV